MDNKWVSILKSTVFLVILFVILSLLANVFTPKNTPASIGDEPANTLDYIVFGDSECYTSISPMELWKAYGYAGYNCGVSSQRIQVTYYQLEKVLRYQSPRVVLLETNLLHRSLSYKQAVDEFVDHYVGENFPLYEYHNEWKKLISGGGEVKKVRNESNIFKGWGYNANITPYTGGPYINETTNIQEIGATQLYYMNKIVALCKKHSIRLILYCVSSPINWSYPRHNAVVKYAAENNLPFLDLNLKAGELAIDWTHDTYDKGDHLNFFGSRKVTNYIGAYLHQNTEMTDHRQDKNYAAWNEKLQAYEERINQKRN